MVEKKPWVFQNFWVNLTAMILCMIAIAFAVVIVGTPIARAMGFLP